MYVILLPIVLPATPEVTTEVTPEVAPEVTGQVQRLLNAYSGESSPVIRTKVAGDSGANWTPIPE